MKKPLKKLEEKVLRRRLENEGFNEKEIKNHLKRLKEEIIKSHEIAKKEIKNQKKPLFKDLFRKDIGR